MLPPVYSPKVLPSPMSSSSVLLAGDGVLEARVYVDCSALLAAVGGCNDPNGDDVLLLHRSLEDLRRPPCCGYGLRMLY